MTMQPTLFETEPPRPRLASEISFTVHGVAQSAGSKQAFVPTDKRTVQPYRNKQGRIIVSVVDDNPKSKDWKAVVAAVARQHYAGPLLEGAVELILRFYRLRPLGHFGTGRNAGVLKSAAPRWPTGTPDVLKLARGVEDALTGVIWRDDAQIVRELLEKHYGEPARVEVTIRSL
jgi:Holliday junction resolvase RusA-like endonuclease